ncbi:MAG: squalene cyclase, partial [Conexibacter sp.]|nr:squalene cyclase [Conexibacter sp.]
MAALLLALVGACAGPGSVVASASASTDVVIAFDTTGSMSGALTEAKTQVQSVITEVNRRFGDVQFAVAGVSDYGSSYGDAGDVPWTLEQPMTADQGKIQAAIDGLYAVGGGDSPEAYGRALQQADLDPAVGFRPGSQRLVVLVADSVPHDDDLNVGIAPLDQTTGSPYDTGVDPGADELFDTADDVDWQQQLATMKAHAIPLYFVLFKGATELLPYWQTWAQATGGAASTSADGSLGSTLVDVISAGAGGCSRAYERVGVLDVCADAIADRGDGTKRATGAVRIAGGVDAGAGPVVIDPAAQTIASEGVVPLGVARRAGLVALGKGAFTIQAAGTKDPISGRDRLAEMALVGADLSAVTIGGIGLAPGGKTYIDPADGGGLVIASKPLFDLLGQGPSGSLSVGLHASTPAPWQLLGGSAGWELPIGRWGVKASLQYTGAEDSWKVSGKGTFPGVIDRPAGDVSGIELSGTLTKGKIDAIGIKASVAGIPLGSTGFFFDSFSGEVSGMAVAPLKLKLGVTGGWGAKLPVIGKRPINLEKADVSVATDYSGSIKGTVGLVDRRLAGGDLDVSMTLDPFRASGRLNADVALLGTGFYARSAVDMTSKHYTATGGAEFKVAGHTMQGGHAILSDEGAGASGKACGICPTVGVGIRWKDAFSFPPTPEWIGADIERYRTVKASAAAGKRRTRTVTVAPGTAVLAVYATPSRGATADVELR